MTTREWYGVIAGGTDGAPILATAVVSPGTTLATAVSGTTHIDTFTVYAINSTGAAVRVTLEIGGTTDPTNLLEIDVPPTGSGPFLCVRVRLQNSKTIAAFDGTGSIISYIVLRDRQEVIV